MSEPAWDGRPPSEERLPVVVVGPRKGSPLVVRLLGPWQGVWLHWCFPDEGLPKGRSVPCMGDNCQFDHLIELPFWYGYAPAQLSKYEYKNEGRDRVHVWKPCICPVTEKMALEILADREPRGLVVQLTRGDVHREIGAEILETPMPSDLMPPFDVRPILKRMWGIRQVPFIKKEPVKKVLLPLHGQAEENGTRRRTKKGGA